MPHHRDKSLPGPK